jgi:hypothetical protein
MRSKKRGVMLFALLVLALPGTGALAFDNATKDRIIGLAFENFWGKARLLDGSYVQPGSEEERQTLPISKETAYQVIEVGKTSGQAKWCSLDWQKNYLALTKWARQQGFSDKQLAFIGLLHGVTQGIVERSMQGKKCDEAEKENVRKLGEKTPSVSFQQPR